MMEEITMIIHANAEYNLRANIFMDKDFSLEKYIILMIRMM